MKKQKQEEKKPHWGSVPEVYITFMKIHLNIRTVSLHYFLCLSTNESVYQYPPVIAAMHIFFKKRTVKYYEKNTESFCTNFRECESISIICM